MNRRKRVFISATTADLGSYRNAVADELRTRDIVPEVQEDFQNHPESSSLPAVLRRRIADCDAVICLAGFYFGWSQPERDAKKPVHEAPRTGRRSYTQLEYDFASQLGKPLFVFLAGEQCPFDKTECLEKQPPELRQLQEEYRSELQGELKCQWFSSRDDLVRQVTRIEFEPREKWESAVLTQFPTPLAVAFDTEFREANDPRTSLGKLRRVMERFFALLAVCDGPADMGVASCGTDAQPAWTDWLRDAGALPEEGGFVTGMRAWLRKSAPLWEAVQAATAVLKRSEDEDTERSAIQAAFKNLREALGRILAGAGFFENHVFARVARCSPHGSTAEVMVFQGRQPRDLTATLAADYPAAAHEGCARLLLLSLSRREALDVEGFFCCAGEAAAADFCGLWRAEAERLSFRRFLTTATMDAPRPAAACAVARRGAVFDAESWQALIRELRTGEAGEGVELRGGTFRLRGERLHQGKVADLFEAMEIGPGDHGGASWVAHMFRESSSRQAGFEEWLRERTRCWSELDHPAKVQILAENPRADDLPHLLARRIPGARSLASVIEEQGKLDEADVLRVLRMAGEACVAAAHGGYQLLSIPTRHILLGGDGALHLTGFDTAASRTAPAWGSGLPRAFLRCFSRDWHLIAPEVLDARAGRALECSADVYALGQLLHALRGTDLAAAASLSAEPDWWSCLAHHCLAENPASRFRDAAHFLRFLDTFRQNDAPITIEVPASDDAPSFAMALHPVTNASYTIFCLERRTPKPWHLRAFETGSADWHEARRLNGPWQPVTSVTIFEAQDYCAWLSRHFGGRWRLPTSAEWLRAAGPSPYPWGASPPDVSLANFGSKPGQPTVVGAYPAGASPHGILDMAGNVWEWCVDFLPDTPPRPVASAFDGSLSGHAAPRRVIKGGAYEHAADDLLSACSRGTLAMHRSAHIGFRVIREST